MSRVFYGEDTMKSLKRETSLSRLKKLKKEELIKTKNSLTKLVKDIDHLIDTYTYESSEYQTIGDCRYLATVAIGTCTDLLRA